MEKQVYEIIEFDLIGTKLKTFKEVNYAEPRIEAGKTIFFDKETGRKIEHNNYFKLSTNNEGAILRTEDPIQLLPYFADVTQDLPGSLKFEPRTYENCQLMAEKHGGYLQFFHKPTGEVLRIAMNSHYYHPTK